MADVKLDQYMKLDVQANEAFKVLRTNIHFCSCENAIKTITVTSSLPGEGKTTVAVNLAAAMAMSEMDVLLVDADMRKPWQMKSASSFYTKGLSSYISGSAELEDIIMRTDVSRLYYVPDGPKPPNPSELLSSSSFKGFLESVKERFDVVIFDTPPLGSAIDGAVIASGTDGTLLVAGSNSVGRRAVLQTQEQLLKVNAKIIGVAFNKVKKGEYKRHYSYCDYGAGKEKTSKMTSEKKQKKVKE